MDGMDEIRLCVGYKKDGQTYDILPFGAENVAGCEPIYETWPGWSETTFGVKRYEELPENARNYLQRISGVLRSADRHHFDRPGPRRNHRAASPVRRLKLFNKTLLAVLCGLAVLLHCLRPHAWPGSLHWVLSAVCCDSESLNTPPRPACPAGAVLGCAITRQVWSAVISCNRFRCRCCLQSCSTHDLRPPCFTAPAWH